MEYSASTIDFFTWDNLRPEADWHPRIKDIVYWGNLSTKVMLTLYSLMQVWTGYVQAIVRH